MADTNSTAEEIETLHPDYVAQVEEWETVEDVCRGSRCVRSKGEKYLPKLTGEESGDYEKRKDRATFFNATKRTREALAGMVLRKKPTIERGGVPEDVLGDITLNGQDVEDYSRRVIEAAVSKGRSGTFIDWSEAENAPYLSFYEAEDVQNWATARIDGREVLIMLSLREFEDVLDGFEVERRKRIRRYWISSENLGDSDEENDKIGSRVLCETWIEDEEGDGKTGFRIENAATEITRRGIPLTRIPFVFHNSGTLGSPVGDAPLFDIAELNVSHYRTSADLENGRHYCGLPTPVVTGCDDSVKDLAIGGETAWLIENEAAKAYFLEFEGTGLGELTKALEEKENQMAKLGARLLFDQKKDVEAFETHALRAGSEGSALGHIAGTCSVSMTEVLQWVEWWGGTLEDPREANATFTFSTDFVGATMAPTMLAELLKTYVAGGMSFEAFFFNLQKGEFYPDDWDLEREAAAIRDAQTMPGPSNANKPDETKEPDEEGDEGDDD